MQNDNGFTLIEITIVLLVIGILVGSIVVPLSSQMEYKKVSETVHLINTAEQALLGYSMNNKRFPCPDISGDGVEDGPPCVRQEGWLPWSSLGIRTRDSWGNALRYHADENYTAVGGIPNPPDTKTGLWVKNHHGFRQSDKNPNALAAIIYSCGRNGKPDLDNRAKGRNQFDVACSNEGDQDNGYVQGPPIEEKYDDILVGISRYIVLYRIDPVSKPSTVPK